MGMLDGQKFMVYRLHYNDAKGWIRYNPDKVTYQDVLLLLERKLENLGHPTGTTTTTADSLVEAMKAAARL